MQFFSPFLSLLELHLTQEYRNFFLSISTQINILTVLGFPGGEYDDIILGFNVV
jgi:hypothetical protein